MYININL